MATALEVLPRPRPRLPRTGQAGKDHVLRVLSLLVWAGALVSVYLVCVVLLFTALVVGPF